MRYIRFGLPLMALIGFGPSLFSQGQGPAPVAPVPMINQSQDPALASFRFRSIGPASMGGRIDDLAISESDPSIMYVGYATGGVFKSVNAGTTFEPIFDVYGTASIGDLAIHPTNPNILYVGTGEANNRQTSSFGDGMYKTTDGGKTFTHIGLRETQTIARIVIDPRNPDAIDGKDYPVIGAANNVAKASAKRVNDTTTESVGKSADGKVIENVTVTVSPDGKTLTRVAKVKGPNGEFTLKSVYDKQ